MNFAISATSNDFSLCWDQKLQQYAWGCGVQDLLCDAWNFIFDELGGHGEYSGNESHGLLNCSQFADLHPLPWTQTTQTIRWVVSVIILIIRVLLSGV